MRPRIIRAAIHIIVTMFFFCAIYIVILETFAVNDVKVNAIPTNFSEPPLDCFMPCTFIIDPICTTDGKKYKRFTNRCLLKSHNCIEEEDWKEVDPKYCKKKTNQTIEACNKKCDNHSAPICGFDGNTRQFFWNNCEKNERECIDGFEWGKVDLEFCVHNKTCDDVCESHIEYVCGFNGKRYNWFKSICLMELENCRKQDKLWKQVSNCKCMVKSETILKNKCSQKCRHVYDPVCGSDGTKTKTFPNTCEMTRYNCLNCTKFSIIHSKACKQSEVA